MHWSLHLSCYVQLHVTLDFGLVVESGDRRPVGGLCGTAFIASIVVPKSPVYLIRRNKSEKARKSLHRLYSDPAHAEGHQEQIKLTIQESEARGGRLSSSWHSILRVQGSIETVEDSSGALIK